MGRSRFKSLREVLILIFLLVFSVNAQELTHELSNCLKELKIKKGDPRLLVLTNAPYVKLKDIDSSKLMSIIEKETGVSYSKNNLWFYHSQQNAPFNVVLFLKDKGEGIVLSYDGKMFKKHLFNLNNDDSLRELIKTRKEAFSIISILDAWANGAPYDLLKCAEFHNHLCPGLLSGYFIVKFIQEYYPLQEGQRYIYISCPPWCKDDAIQVLLDLTSGKRGLYVRDLSEEEKEKLPDRNVAGVFVLWNESHKEGKGVIISFNWDVVYQTCGVDRKALQEDPIMGRVKINRCLLKKDVKKEDLVKVLKEVEVSETVLKGLLRGSNPYKLFGLEG
jgi:formylmethanofuran dehydrogenase subunit E-like metal-binding protein